MCKELKVHHWSAISGAWTSYPNFDLCVFIASPTHSSQARQDPEEHMVVSENNEVLTDRQGCVKGQRGARLEDSLGQT